MPTNAITWWELATHDADKSVEFFRNVFGWKIEFDERVGFHTIVYPEGQRTLEGGGVFTLRKARLPFLTLYIEVDDIDAKARQIEEAGGFLVEPPFEIAKDTRICLFNEPSGVTFAMIQARTAGETA